MGVWRRLEDWLLELQRDRPRLAKYVTVAWWVSNLFLAIGAVIILLIVSGAWEP